ncbi:hypothetical protein HYX12_03285 [Candidatus Woesearchaeota archaeon]|nr:hypothetical protein [Candidatus Woesearchaeota archaeon]
MNERLRYITELQAILKISVLPKLEAILKKYFKIKIRTELLDKFEEQFSIGQMLVVKNKKDRSTLLEINIGFHSTDEDFTSLDSISLSGDIKTNLFSDKLEVIQLWYEEMESALEAYIQPEEGVTAFKLRAVVQT